MTLLQNFRLQKVLTYLSCKHYIKSSNFQKFTHLATKQLFTKVKKYFFLDSIFERYLHLFYVFDNGIFFPESLLGISAAIASWAQINALLGLLKVSQSYSKLDAAIPSVRIAVAVPSQTSVNALLGLLHHHLENSYIRRGVSTQNYLFIYSS